MCSARKDFSYSRFKISLHLSLQPRRLQCTALTSLLRLSSASDSTVRWWCKLLPFNWDSCVIQKILPLTGSLQRQRLAQLTWDLIGQFSFPWEWERRTRAGSDRLGWEVVINRFYDRWKERLWPLQSCRECSS